MSGESQKQWQVAARPSGRALALTDFQLATAPVRQPGAGEVLLQTLYLSFDPAQKYWMENAADYIDPVEIGGVMPGYGVGEVVASQHPAFKPGDLAHGLIGWRERPCLAASALAPVQSGATAVEALGVLGLTGKTAYFGLIDIGKPRPGDTLVVSGAAGATGSVVGQIGKIAGCRVIGIAGGPEKCRWLVEELGFDGAIDYKNERVGKRLRALCPDGINIFYDNVGGDILNTALAQLAPAARVVICGGISRYNSDLRDPEQVPPGPPNYFAIVFSHATIQGFLVFNFADRFDEAERRLLAWSRAGRLRHREDIIEGFENAPAALMRLFEGRNIGKQLLKL